MQYIDWLTPLQSSLAVESNTPALSSRESGPRPLTAIETMMEIDRKGDKSLKELSLGEINTLVEGQRFHEDPKTDFTNYFDTTPLEGIKKDLERYEEIDQRERNQGFRNILRSVTGNFGDEALAYINARGDDEAYAKNRRFYDKEAESYQQKYPVADFAQAIGPLAALTLATRGKLGGGRLAAKLGSVIPRNRFLRPMALSGAAGFTFGAGDKKYDDSTSRLLKGAKETPLAAGLGLAFPLLGSAGRGVGKRIPGIKNKMADAQIVQNLRNRFRTDPLEDAGTPLGKSKLYDSKYDDPLIPVSMRNDALTDETTELAGLVLDSPADLRVATQAVEAISQGRTLKNIVDKEGKSTVLDKQKVREAYETALNDDKLITNENIINALVTPQSGEVTRLTRIFQEGIRDKRKSLQGKTNKTDADKAEIEKLSELIDSGFSKEAFKNGISIRTLASIKEAFDDAYKDTYSWNKIKDQVSLRKRGRDDYQEYKKWLNEVDNEKPLYKKARASLSDQLEDGEAFVNGQMFFNPFRPERNIDVIGPDGLLVSNIFARNFNSMKSQKSYYNTLTQGQKDSYREGALEALQVKTNKILNEGTQKNPAEALFKEFKVADKKELIERLKLILDGDDAELIGAALDLDRKVGARALKIQAQLARGTGKETRARLEKSDIPRLSRGRDFTMAAVEGVTQLVAKKNLPPAAKKRLLYLLTSNKQEDIAVAIRLIEKANTTSKITDTNNLPATIKDTLSLVLGIESQDLGKMWLGNEETAKQQTTNTTASSNVPSSNVLSPQDLSSIWNSVRKIGDED